MSVGTTITIVLLIVIALQLWTISDRLRNADSAQEKELRELLRSELRYRAQQRDSDIEIHHDQIAQARERSKKWADDLSNFSKKPE